MRGSLSSNALARRGSFLQLAVAQLHAQPPGMASTSGGVNGGAPWGSSTGGSGKLAADGLDYRPGPPQASWAALAAAHAWQYAALALLIVLLGFSERGQPFHKVIYSQSDAEWWRYSYPLKDNHVPAWAVPCVAVFSPLAVVALARLLGRISRLEAHHAAFMAVSCVALTGLLTNWIKLNVGRPRPDFVARCWPGGGPHVFTPEGLPKCAEHAVDPIEGIKSFPSGHTSWSTSGLGYLTFWLLGHLRCFDGSAQPARFVVSLLPLCGAAGIGMTRLQDYWHHVEDVAAGFALGLLMAYCFYRQLYCSPMGEQAGLLTAAARAASSSPSGSSEGNGHGLPLAPSRQRLLSGSAGQLDLERQPSAADDRV